MTRTEVREFLESGVRAINPQMPFGSGRITEWNSNRSNEYPGTWWESIAEDDSVELSPTQLPIDSWPINLHIGKLDQADSLSTQYELIIDECYTIAQKLVRQYNQVVSGSSEASITGIGRKKFVKKHADCVSGVILSFTLSLPDKTNLC